MSYVHPINPNFVWAGPASGTAGLAGWRSLVAADIPSLSGVYLPLAGGTMAGVIAMGANKITGLANGSASTDAAAFGQIVVNTVTSANGLSLTAGTLAFSSSGYVLTSGSYSNPSWLTGILGSIVSGNISGNAANITATSNGTLTALTTLVNAPNLVSTNYISQPDLIQYSSTTQIQVAAGSCYSPKDSQVITWASALTNSPTLSASTRYYVYVSGTTPAITVSTTAPTAYSNYPSSYQKPTTLERYVGSFLTDASSHIVNFWKSGNCYYYKTNISGSPFSVLAGGSATSATSVNCSGCVPSTSRVAIVQFLNIGGAAISIGSSDGVVPSSSAYAFEVGNGTSSSYCEFIAHTPLNSSQTFQYCGQASGGNLYCNVNGFVEPI